MKINLSKSVFCLSILFFLMLAASALAGKPEAPLPGMPTRYLPALPNYIKAIFEFSLLLAGLVAFGALIIGGFRYMTSAGDSNKMGDAKSQAFAGLLGLVIILSSYVILGTVNPRLAVLKPPGFEAAATGIILYDTLNDCNNDKANPAPGKIEGEDYFPLRFSSPNLPAVIRFRPLAIYFFEPRKELKVELFAEKNYKDANGDPEPFKIFNQLGDSCYSIGSTNPKSIKLTLQKTGVYLYTDTYPYPSGPWRGKSSLFQISQSRLPPGFYNLASSIQIVNPSSSKNTCPPNNNCDTGEICVKGSCVIPKYGAILHGQTEFRGKAEAFLRSWPNLLKSVWTPTTLTRIGNIIIEDPLDPDSAPSSITVFRQNPDVSSANTITLCRNPDCKDEGGVEAKLVLDFDDFEDLSSSYFGYDSAIIRGIPDIKSDVSGYTWSNGDGIDYGYSKITPEGISAVQFEPGNYILILFKETNYKGEALVLRSTEMNLDSFGFNDKVASMIIIKGQ